MKVKPAAPNPYTSFKGLSSIGAKLRILEHGFIHNSETPVRESSECGGIGPDEAALPPYSGGAFLLQGAEPILPEHSANQMRRCAGKGIAYEQPEYGAII